MARTYGSFINSKNYEVTATRPFDARMLVPTYADLTLKDNWLALDPDTLELTSKSIAFNGLIVAVADKNDVERSGLYMLFDKESKKTPNVENAANWLKIGETSDASELIDRLNAIDESIAAINDRLDNLEKNKAEIATYGYREGFPAEGQAGIMYIAVDEKKSYIWFNNEYLPVSGDTYEEPEIIFGGSAD